MHYVNPDPGFSFDLPEGWHHDGSIRPLTFLGPNGRIGRTSELIQMRVGTILPKYVDPGARERFLAEPGAKVSRGRLGDEANVVVFTKPSESEISAVRDALHYVIAHANDSATQKAVQMLTTSFSFPSPEEVAEAISRRMGR